MQIELKIPLVIQVFFASFCSLQLNVLAEHAHFLLFCYKLIKNFDKVIKSLRKTVQVQVFVISNPFYC